MKKEKILYGIVTAAALAVIAAVAVYSASTETTDMIVPALDIAAGMTQWYVLTAVIVAELLVVRLLLKEDWLKTAAVTTAANAVSLAPCFITMLMVGLLVEVVMLPLDTATYHISHWIADCLAFVAFNAAFEALVAKVGFKLSFKKMFLVFMAANAAGLVICFIFNTWWLSHIYF